MTYKLNVDMSVKPIRKKKRRHVPERQITISDKVDKLLKVSFIREIYYPDWLSNVVLVKKSSGK